MQHRGIYAYLLICVGCAKLAAERAVLPTFIRNGINKPALAVAIRIIYCRPVHIVVAVGPYQLIAFHLLRGGCLCKRLYVHRHSRGCRIKAARVRLDTLR